MIHEVILHELPRGRHRVEYQGKVLVASSSDPTFAACRALLARGITGKMETRRAGSPLASLRVVIEWGAGRRSNEDRRRFEKYAEHPLKAIRVARLSEKTAISSGPVPGGPKTEIAAVRETSAGQMA